MKIPGPLSSNIKSEFPRSRAHASIFFKQAPLVILIYPKEPSEFSMAAGEFSGLYYSFIFSMSVIEMFPWIHAGDRKEISGRKGLFVWIVQIKYKNVSRTRGGL